MEESLHMHSTKLQGSESGHFRTFRICLEHPHRPTTILGIVRRVATQQVAPGRDRRTTLMPRRTGAFA
jgi:hypothetical protein